MKIVVLEGKAVSSDVLNWDILGELGDVTIYENSSEEDKWEKIKDADVVLVNKVLFNEEVFEKNPKLKYVGVCATGYNNVDLEAARSHNVAVTYAPAYSTPSVVQMTWAFILELACRVHIHAKSVEQGDWSRSGVFTYTVARITELTDKILGIYGFGNIGREVAKIAKAFGMKVLVCTKHPEKYEGEANFVSEEELFRKSDIISFHCPLTEETREKVNKDTIDMMKDGVMIVNVSRGLVVNEADLRDALISGKVAAAAVDVVSAEPIKEDNPLLSAPNIVITPHIAWATIEAKQRLLDIVVENLKAFLDGKELNRV